MLCNNGLTCVMRCAQVYIMNMCPYLLQYRPISYNRLIYLRISPPHIYLRISFASEIRRSPGISTANEPNSRLEYLLPH